MSAKTLTCSCGHWAFKIVTREECKDCEHNLCVWSVDGICDCVDCKQEESPCDGKSEDARQCPQYLPSAAEDYECEMGDCGDAGCALITCASCGRLEEHWPKRYE